MTEFYQQAAEWQQQQLYKLILNSVAPGEGEINIIEASGTRMEVNQILCWPDTNVGTCIGLGVVVAEGEKDPWRVTVHSQTSGMCLEVDRQSRPLDGERYGLLERIFNAVKEGTIGVERVPVEVEVYS